jgi:acyl-CoA thioesterase FadM
VILRDAELITEAEITLCCISIAKQRICSIPSTLLALASKA